MHHWAIVAPVPNFTRLLANLMPLLMISSLEIISLLTIVILPLLTGVLLRGAWPGVGTTTLAESGWSEWALEVVEEVLEWNGEATAELGLFIRTVSHRTGDLKKSSNSLVKDRKISHKINVVGTNDVELIIERWRIGCNVYFGRCVEQECFIHRTLLKMMKRKSITNRQLRWIPIRYFDRVCCLFPEEEVEIWKLTWQSKSNNLSNIACSGNSFWITLDNAS